MKTQNGSNKLERQITNSKKWLGIDLVEKSNKYLKIESNEKEVYFVATGSVKELNTKYGEKFLVELMNSNKNYWIPNYRGVKAYDALGKHIGYVLKFILDEKELLDGHDDIFELNDDLRKQICIAKR